MENLIFGKQECTFGDKTFPHGSELCEADVCKLCENGSFEIPPELSLDEDEVWADPGEAYFVPS